MNTPTKCAGLRTCRLEAAVSLSAWNIWADVSLHVGTERMRSDAFGYSHPSLRPRAMRGVPGRDLIGVFGVDVGLGRRGDENRRGHRWGLLGRALKQVRRFSSK